MPGVGRRGGVWGPASGREESAWEWRPAEVRPAEVWPAEVWPAEVWPTVLPSAWVWWMVMGLAERSPTVEGRTG